VTGLDAAPALGSVPGPDAGAGEAPRLVAVVATVKGSPEEARRFVRRNLRAGADHVVVIVDDADPAVLGALREDPDAAERTTAIGAGDRYWREGRWTRRRPSGLNQRQGIGANLANCLVSCVPRFDWLFHLDLDERLHLDRQRLLGLRRGVRAVTLEPLEAVSTEVPEEPTRYKRRPNAATLTELHRRGLIDEPTGGAYYRGHSSGKQGIRPDPRLRLGIHRVREPGGEVVVEPLHREWLQVLHDESLSFEDFVRKWTALSSAGAFWQKPRRQELGELVLAALNDRSLEAAPREERLRALYRSHVADDVAALEELGLVTTPRPEWSAYPPEELSDAERATLAGVAAVLAEAPKRAFDRFGPPAEQLLQELHDREAKRGADPLVLAGLRAAVARTAASSEGGVSGSRA
jgi:hypothetical protein